MSSALSDCRAAAAASPADEVLWGRMGSAVAKPFGDAASESRARKPSQITRVALEKLRHITMRSTVLREGERCWRWGCKIVCWDLLSTLVQSRARSSRRSQDVAMSRKVEARCRDEPGGSRWVALFIESRGSCLMWAVAGHTQTICTWEQIGALQRGQAPSGAPAIHWFSPCHR